MKIKIILICLIIIPLIAHSGICGQKDEDQLSKDDMGRGRIPLVITATIYSGGLYGWGIPYLLDAKFTRQYVGSEMVCVFSGFALSLLATKDYDSGPAVSKIIQGGAVIGTLYGFAIPAIFNSDKTKAYIATPMLTTPLGALGGYGLSRRGGMSEGGVELSLFGSILGCAYGLATPYIINVESVDDKDQMRIYAGSAMIGMPIGAFGFNEIAKRTDVSKGRTRMIELGTCMGIYYGFNFVYIKDPGRTKPYIASMMACAPIGTTASILLTRNGSYENGRSMLIILGTILGDVFGRGVAYLAGADTWREVSIGAIIFAPLGTFTTSILTRNMSPKIQKKMALLESLPIIDTASKLALIGAYSTIAKDENSAPIYLELYCKAF
ncbi:TPA: hypothetical protein ENX78_18730 [Candidatus Poribacteria bacterium]|nr:hypothetical protein [Candidatus Poribacteria bacterium]